jgi:ankyrin repeat protein
LDSAAENWIAILEASRAGDAKRVRELLDLGTHPDSPDIFSGHTPLHHAITANNLEIVNLLLDAGADVNHRNNNTASTPLELAVVSLRTEMVRALVSRGANLNPDGNSIIDVARQESTPEIVKILELNVEGP